MAEKPLQGHEREPPTFRHAQNEPSKRIRVSQACALCRSRKIKCDGERPACSTCRGLSQPCVYDPNPKKRGVPAGHTTVLERRVLTMELVSSLLMDRLDDAVSETVRSFLSLDQDPSMAEVETWNKKATALLEKWKAGPMSEWVREMSTRSDVIDDLSESRSHAWRSASVSNSVGKDETSFPKRQTESTNRSQNGGQSIELPQFDPDISSKHGVYRTPKNTQKLLDIYFAYTHTWLPLVDKFKIISFAQQNSSDRGGAGLSSQDSGNLALLWAIIACASPHLSDQEQPSLEGETIAYEAAFLNARSLLPVNESDFKPAHTQTLILLSLSRFWHGSWKSAWALIGLAGRLAVDIKAPSSMLPPYHLLSSERRTCLACFVVEGLIAAYLGRETQHVALHSLTQKPHTEANIRWQLEEDGWEEWGNWTEPDEPSKSSTSTLIHNGPSRTLSTFNQLVLLIEIMNKMLFTAHVFDASQDLRTIYVTISKQLFNWYNNLESSYPFQGLSKSQRPLLHVLNLHLIYWTQRCILYTHDPIAEVDSEFARELSERPNHLASKVNDIIMLYKTSYKVTLSSLIISNAVAAAIPLVDSSSTLGVQLRGYMEEIEQIWKPADANGSSERAIFRNEVLRRSNNSVTWDRGIPKTMELDKPLDASIVMPNDIQPLEIDTQRRLWPFQNGSHEHLSPRRSLRSKEKKPARASIAAETHIYEPQRSMDVDHDVTSSNIPLQQPQSDHPSNTLIRNISHGENNLVPGLSLDPGILGDMSLFYPGASGTVSDQGNSSTTPGHDLTILDAVSWTDELLAKNFGYIGDFSDPQELYGNLEEFSFDHPNHL